ncbi:hypothetical protein [Prosthecodimorpha staleyi]|uniref:Uncharacterized protein n=1 Tax=Prosthecodimorpha staleyi TaxID=2840188 RepID=A0A947GJW9_9HYPH|nr:hypothetical protein [Prosthecodimorpha staleyi]MBT9292594.1 hypothetical protein [Prosthecodimorpha staleyi]
MAGLTASALVVLAGLLGSDSGADAAARQKDADSAVSSLATAQGCKIELSAALRRLLLQKAGRVYKTRAALDAAIAEEATLFAALPEGTRTELCAALAGALK